MRYVIGAQYSGTQFCRERLRVAIQPLLKHEQTKTFGLYIRRGGLRPTLKADTGRDALNLRSPDVLAAGG